MRLLAWSDTAEAIARRFDEYPECMRSFSGENGDVLAGLNEIRVYWPVGGQNKWLYHEDTSEIDLRASGETIAMFVDLEDAFADPTAYPATEADISNFEEWTTIKRPALPSRIGRDLVDVIAVTADGLKLLEPGGDEPRSTTARQDGDADDLDSGEAADGN